MKTQLPCPANPNLPRSKKTGEFFGLKLCEQSSQKCYADAVPGELWFGDLASKREGKLLKNCSVPLPTQF